MFLFPLIYISSFLFALKEVLSRNREGVLLFLIFGLPIYTTTLAVTMQLGAGEAIPVLQPLKEILILLVLGLSLKELRIRVKLTITDYAILGYLAYTSLYAVLPIGTYGFAEKLVALKSSSFFALIYLAGRLFDPTRIYISKYFTYILLVFIAACVVLIYEKLSDQHFQTLTGYADFNFYYFNQEPTGNYGLSWTFETSTGLKRFSSFFANPLEFAASTLLALAVLAGLYTDDDNKIKLDKLGVLALIATQIAIFLALSRSSLGSYFIMIYFYALLTGKKQLLKLFYALCIIGTLYFLFFMLVNNPDLYEFIYETITFTNPSSVGHVLAWIEGIESIAANPLGIGLGQSGRVAVAESDTVGGENQFIIIGVQTGIIGLILYLFIHLYLIRTCWKSFRHLKGKERKVCLSVLLMKIGFFIPLFTSELESSVYISYISWFLSGLFINMLAGDYRITKTAATSPYLNNA